MNTVTPSIDLIDYMASLGNKARKSTKALRLATPKQKTQALYAMAEEIRKSETHILEANAKDMNGAKAKGLSGAMLDRLALTTDRIAAMAAGIDAIAILPDPVGSVDETWTQPNGLHFSKVRVPIGVIGMIYESRPNVTADAGALCVKSGNACILRGGSESAQSSQAIHMALTRGLKVVGLPETSIQIIATTDRAAVGHLLGGMDGSVDLIIPRGGKNLIARVQKDARVPVLAHLEGLCHTYVHQSADIEKAKAIILNAKLRRTGVCGSTETLLIDKAVATKFLPEITQALIDRGCELRADAQACAVLPTAKLASQEDFRTEHLSAILNIKVVNDLDDALDHIATYGSGHTDCILSENDKATERFFTDVDSAIVMHNASTQFADGGEFGFGAEIGIATGRLHARGPVGAQHLTTYKYCVDGTGQVRP